MAAQKTSLADIYEPEIWSQYLLEQTTKQSALVQAGIMGTDPDIADAAAKGGRTVELPFWKDLVNDYDADANSVSVPGSDTDDDITPTGIESGKDIAVKMFRNKAWEVASIVKYEAGSDPVKIALQRYINWWKMEEQRLLLKILTGIFADATVKANLSYEPAGEEATTDPEKLIGATVINAAKHMLGDARGKLTAIAMHSDVSERLENLNLIDTIQDSQQAGVEIKKYGNLTVIEDDNLPVEDGVTSGHKYTSFLFGLGAIARQEVALESDDPGIEVLREPKKGYGSGRNTVITRRGFILHPRGIKYTGSLSTTAKPTDAELAADNWDQVYSTKNIRIVRLITNG